MRLLTLLFIAAFTLFAAGDYSNRRAPGFSLADVHYKQHDPQDYRGKVLLVDIMVTTCQTCARLANNLRDVAAKFEGKVGVISIVTLPDSHDTVSRFTADHKIPWPVVFDCGQVIASYLKVTPENPQVHFPHLFLIDKQGVIRADFDGADEKALSPEGLAAEIDKLIRQP